jgi:hypothetical protein
MSNSEGSIEKNMRNFDLNLPLIDPEASPIATNNKLLNYQVYTLFVRFPSLSFFLFYVYETYNF